MLDSAIKAEPTALLNGLLSNTCWGQVEQGNDADGTPPSWVLVSAEPSLVAPKEGLKTYLQVPTYGVPTYLLAATYLRSTEYRLRWPAFRAAVQLVVTYGI